jgi:MFS family permease
LITVSINRTLAAIGALLAGFLAGTIGERPTLAGVIALFTAAAVAVALSPLRDAPTVVD